MQKIAPKDRFNPPLKKSKQLHEKHFNLTDPAREFPSIEDLLGQKKDWFLSRQNEEELPPQSDDLKQDENTISISIPQIDLTSPSVEKTELKLDQQVVIDDIVKTLTLTENSTQESKAVLNVTIGGEAVMVEIVKRKNRTKVQFSSENGSVRRILKNTKGELTEAAKRAGINLHRIEVR